MPNPTSSLYDLRLSEANGNLERLQATPDTIEILSITPSIGQNFNTVVRVKIDVYPEIGEDDPLPEGAKAKYIYRTQKLMRAHITQALTALLGKPTKSFPFVHQALTEISEESLSNYFEEIGLGLTEGEFKVVSVSPHKYRLDVTDSINFYGSVYFTDEESGEDDEEEPTLTPVEPDDQWIEINATRVTNATVVNTDPSGNLDTTIVVKSSGANSQVSLIPTQVTYQFQSEDIEITGNNITVVGLASGTSFTITANLVAGTKTATTTFTITNPN